MNMVCCMACLPVQIILTGFVQGVSCAWVQVPCKKMELSSLQIMKSRISAKQKAETNYLAYCSAERYRTLALLMPARITHTILI